MTRVRLLAGVGAVLLAFGASACSDGDSDLSELAKRGKETSNANGCASCHGANGQGGVGPTWVGIAGTEVELKDGTTMIRDDEYLIRSILDPTAEEVAGFTLVMPVNGLSEAQAADVVTYIKELGTDAP